MKLPTPNLPAINLGPVQSFANEFVWGASLQERWTYRKDIWKGFIGNKTVTNDANIENFENLKI